MVWILFWDLPALPHMHVAESSSTFMLSGQKHEKEGSGGLQIAVQGKTTVGYSHVNSALCVRFGVKYITSTLKGIFTRSALNVNLSTRQTEVYF